jgi:hypothetical protein
MASERNGGKGIIGAIAALVLAWNGCGFVSETASVYEEADYITVYDRSGDEHILEAKEGWHARPNKNRNIPLGTVMILAAAGLGLWSMCQFE